MYHNAWLIASLFCSLLVMEIKKRFGLAVKEHRQLSDVSQEELAIRIDADQGYISRVEAGLMNVTLETVEQIAKALNTDVANLLKLPAKAKTGNS